MMATHRTNVIGVRNNLRMCVIGLGKHMSSRSLFFHMEGPPPAPTPFQRGGLMNCLLALQAQLDISTAKPLTINVMKGRGGLQRKGATVAYEKEERGLREAK